LSAAESCHRILTNAPARFEPIALPDRLTIWLDNEPINRIVRLMSYNWPLSDWPVFRYELDGVEESLLAFADHAGRVSGMLEGLPDDLGTEVVLDLMIAEAIRSSAIDGETLNRDAVMSSIRNRLGLNPVTQPVDSRMDDGAGELMVAVRSGFREPLSEETLFSWHRMLLGGTAGRRVGCRPR
jgi:Fic family protein